MKESLVPAGLGVLAASLIVAVALVGKREEQPPPRISDFVCITDGPYRGCAGMVKAWNPESRVFLVAGKCQTLFGLKNMAVRAKPAEIMPLNDAACGKLGQQGGGNNSNGR